MKRFKLIKILSKIIKFIKKPEKGIKITIDNKEFVNNNNNNSVSLITKRVYSNYVQNNNFLVKNKNNFFPKVKSEKKIDNNFLKTNENISQNGQFRGNSGNTLNLVDKNDEKLKSTSNLPIPSKQKSNNFLASSTKIEHLKVEIKKNSKNALLLEDLNQENNIKITKPQKMKFDHKKNLDRIVPYTLFSEKCEQVLKEIKYSSKNQKVIYDFNNQIINGSEQKQVAMNYNQREFQSVLPNNKNRLRRCESSKMEFRINKQKA